MTKRHVPQVDRASQTVRSVHLIIPTGTQVVSRAEVRDATGAVVCPLGAAGAIIRSPEDDSHAYRVRLPDGREVSLRRRELSIRKHVQQEELEDTGGVLTIEEDSLYPPLYRLEKRGELSHEWRTSERNRRAKYYRLTTKGKKRLASEL